MLDIDSMTDTKEALARAIKAVGGLDGLAKPLGITAQAVSQWEEVPPLRVLAVERISGVSRCELRPDLYPPVISSEAAEMRA